MKKLLALALILSAPFFSRAQQTDGTTLLKLSMPRPLLTSKLRKIKPLVLMITTVK